MKKLGFLFSLFVLLSCSSSNEGSNNSDFNPPAWIQGTWMQEGSDAGTGSGFKFSKNDLCLLISIAHQCQQRMISTIKLSGQRASVEEIITSTSYSTTITIPGRQSVTYLFTKLSDNQIEWSASTGVFIKQ